MSSIIQFIEAVLFASLTLPVVVVSAVFELLEDTHEYPSADHHLTLQSCYNGLQRECTELYTTVKGSFDEMVAKSDMFVGLVCCLLPPLALYLRRGTGTTLVLATVSYVFGFYFVSFWFSLLVIKYTELTRALRCLNYLEHFEPTPAIQ